MDDELTLAEIARRVPAAREMLEAIPIEVLRAINDPQYQLELIMRAEEAHKTEQARRGE